MLPELKVQSLNPGLPGKPASPHFTDEEIEVQSGAPSGSGLLRQLSSLPHFSPWCRAEVYKNCPGAANLTPFSSR